MNFNPVYDKLALKICLFWRRQPLLARDMKKGESIGTEKRHFSDEDSGRKKSSFQPRGREMFFLFFMALAAAQDVVKCDSSLKDFSLLNTVDKLIVTWEDAMVTTISLILTRQATANVRVEVMSWDSATSLVQPTEMGSTTTISIRGARAAEITTSTPAPTAVTTRNGAAGADWNAAERFQVTLSLVAPLLVGWFVNINQGVLAQCAQVATVTVTLPSGSSARTTTDEYV
jgi:hypothetical protein